MRKQPRWSSGLFHYKEACYRRALLVCSLPWFSVPPYISSPLSNNADASVYIDKTPPKAFLEWPYMWQPLGLCCMCASRKHHVQRIFIQSCLITSGLLFQQCLFSIHVTISSIPGRVGMKSVANSTYSSSKINSRNSLSYFR